MNYKITKEGNYKYNNMIIVDTPTDAFPTMVLIQKGPQRAKSLIGRKYITLEKAIKAVDALTAESLISKGGRKVNEELTGVFGLDIALEL